MVDVSSASVPQVSAQSHDRTLCTVVFNAALPLRHPLLSLAKSRHRLSNAVARPTCSFSSYEQLAPPQHEGNAKPFSACDLSEKRNVVNRSNFLLHTFSARFFTLA